MSPGRVLKLLTFSTALFSLISLLPGQQPNTANQKPGQDRASSSRAADAAQSADGGSTLKEADRKFLQRVAANNQMEIEISRMAAQKASHPDVKAYAQRMVDDHTATLQQIQDLAQSKNVQMQDHDPSKNRNTNRLHSLTGQEFDRAYMTQQVRHHQKDVAEFERQFKSNGDPEVRAFAERTLPTLRDHLERARTVSSVASSGTAQSVSRATQASDQPDIDGRKN
jgi:putative membrane protein